MSLKLVKKDLQDLKNSEKAKVLSGFFKTAKGQYGEGDKFLGIVVPEQRKIVKKYFKSLELADLQNLLDSDIHEYRLVAVLSLVAQYTKADDKTKKQIYDFYLKNAKRVNNWDLVDLSAPNIVGDYLLNKDRKILYKLLKSKNLWERRISILATFTFIRNNKFEDTLKISEELLSDKHDLIHKATGWMLRELGKRDQKRLEEFLEENIKKMPRTCLRYAIEKFPEEQRKAYLKK